MTEPKFGDPSDPLNPNPSSEHFTLYRSKDAFGNTLSLLHGGGYPVVLLHQPFNEWSKQQWDAALAKRNEEHLLRMLEKAYRQGRESMRTDLMRLLGTQVDPG
jgi:hypothetical protein